MRMIIKHVMAYFVIFGTMTAASAQTIQHKQAEYVACDGFWKPTKNSDEFDWPQQDKNGNGLVRDNIGHYGEAGLKACDLVLGDPGLSPILLNRRANLMVAKAMHLVTMQRYDEALKVLDNADALPMPREDRVFADGVGMRSAFVRAFALAKIGKTREATSLADSIVTRRAYSPSVSMAAISLARSIDRDLDKYLQQLGTLSQQWPENLNTMFWLQLGQAQYQDAIKSGTLIEFALPKNRGGWRVMGEEREALRQLIERAEVRGALAYALHFAGRTEDSKKLFTEIRTETEAATPEPLPVEKKQSKRAVEQFELQDYVLKLALNRLDSWEKAITLRTAASALTSATFPEWAKQAIAMPKIIRFDLAEGLPPALRGELNIEDRPESRKKAMTDMLSFDLSQLIKQAATPESRKTIPKIRRAGDSFMRVDNGYSRSVQTDSPSQTIRYHNTQAGRERVEEIGLLAAAMYAELEGKDSILILNRRTLERSLTTDTGYNVYTDQDGYETQMVTLLTNAADIPIEYAAHKNRLIPAAPILAELKPRFEIKEIPAQPVLKKQ